MTSIIHFLIGYSIVAPCILYVAYVFFLRNVNKSPRALVTCALLLVSLVQLQIGHVNFLSSQADLLASGSYRFWLFLAPPAFYLCSRSILFEESHWSPALLLHLVPVVLPFVIRIEIAMPILFCIGTGYSLWLTHVLYTLGRTRVRSRFELFFFSLFSVLAVGVLLFGFSLPYIDPSYFFTFYAVAIALAMVLVVAALLSFPDLLADIAEAAKASYATSTLGEVNVDAAKTKLQQLMAEDRIYQQEDINLSSVAQAMSLSSHQLSELINTEFGVSFSKFVRQHRVEQAIELLKAEPTASVLSISMQVGFRSQSNFYAAFKEITGRSPSFYRT
jgi:AraC-like DNA-binding protein